MAKRFLIVRTDRLGDVLLTTPMAAALREAYPDAHIAFLVRPYAAPLLKENPAVDSILLEVGQSSTALIDQLAAEKFDVAFIAHPRWRSTWAVYRAGIPRRIGPASKFTAFFLRTGFGSIDRKGESTRATTISICFSLSG